MKTHPSSYLDGTEDISRRIDKEYYALEEVISTLDAQTQECIDSCEGLQSDFHFSLSALRSKLTGHVRELRLLGRYMRFIRSNYSFYSRANFLHGLQKLATQCSEEFFDEDTSFD